MRLRFKINNTYFKLAFDDEIRALRLLQNDYKCRCIPMRNHFPILKNLICLPIPHLQIIGTNNKGVTLENILETKENIYIPDIHKQCACICENLERSNIEYLDSRPRNICIDGNGTISLIDFGVVRIKGMCQYACQVELQKQFHKRVIDHSIVDNYNRVSTGTHDGLPMDEQRTPKATYKSLVDTIESVVISTTRVPSR